MTSKDQTWNTGLYNDKHSFVYSYGAELIQLLDPKSHERILDLGCGSGQLTYEISRIARDVLGIDKSTEMIADARRKFPEVRFEMADAANFKFEEPFDAIFSNATLHWVKDYKAAAKSMFENLKSGGRIVLEFGAKGNVQTIVNQLRESLRSYDYHEAAETQPWFFPSIGDYASVLENVGFKVTHAEHFKRPTELADQDSGIIDWLFMFAGNFLKGIKSDDQQKICRHVQENLKKPCLKDGKWYADYQRIRIIGYKEDS